MDTPSHLAMHETPGLYIEEPQLVPLGVAQVETAVPAFIGYTQKAEKDGKTVSDKAVAIQSMIEFQQYFGGEPDRKITVELTSANTIKSVSMRSLGYLYDSLMLFFANGGGRCYVVSVGSYANPVSPSDFTNALDELKTLDEPTLVVMPDAMRIDNPAQISWVQQKTLDHCQMLQDRFAILDVKIADLNKTAAAAQDITIFRSGISNYLPYGAAYYPWLKTSLPFEVNLTNLTVKKNGKIVTLNELLPAGAKTAAGATVYALQSDLTNRLKTSMPEVRGKVPVFDTIVSAAEAQRIILPPSGVVAGIYARVDANRGVWKAPANEVISKVVGPTVFLTDADQAVLNVDINTGKSINAIRFFTGKGTLVWGARTLAGNDNEWRYVSVRRFFIMVEESVKKATAPFVFEPNDANTWVKVRAMIENFLTLQWRAGALTGSKPEHAFYVRVGLGQTMTAQDLLDGFLLVEIGMAVVRPAEFVVFRFSHKMQEP